MDVELIEIQDFLANHAPFDQLPEATLGRLPRLLAVRYFRRGMPFPPPDRDSDSATTPESAAHRDKPEGTEEPCVYILRRGAVELRDEQGNLVAKLAEGDMCDMRCRQRLPPAVFAALAADAPEAEEDDSELIAASQPLDAHVETRIAANIEASLGGGATGASIPLLAASGTETSLDLTGNTAEDTLVYELPCSELDRLRREHPTFAEHFDQSVSRRLRKALDIITDAPGHGAGLMTVTARDLLRRASVTAPPSLSIQEAACIMATHNDSSLLIMDEERLVGMITDRDLRNRCVAVGRSTDCPVQDIMTKKISTIRADTLGFQALVQMTRLNVHHLPVVDEGKVIGTLSTTDLTRFQSASAVYLVGDIRRAESVETLVAISSKLGELQVQLINGGATANHVGQAITAITDAFTLRLIELAEAMLGPAPVPYAWMVGGSQARREQSSHSDQDNALLIADHMSEDDDEWFAALANFVNDGLHACGYVYCPGNVMAKNPKWRQPLRIWTKYFNTWMRRPEPMSLMLSSVFFDLRALHDPEQLFGELNERVLQLSKTNRIYIAYMAANALKHRPPLGFFRNFVLIYGGEHDRTVDIKHRGTVPIIDLARVYALSIGLNEINTIERLQAAADTEALSREGGASLIDAFELVGTLRMRHQAQQLRAGQKADNFLKPEQLSALERGHLKDAFVLINTMQETLGQRYQSGRFA